MPSIPLIVLSFDLSWWRRTIIDDDVAEYKYC